MDYELRGKKSIRRKRSCWGFSLLELLFVIAVAAVLVGMSSIALMATLNAYRLSTSTTQLKADITYVSQLATGKNRSIEIRFFKHSYLKGGFLDEEFRSYQFVEQNSKSGEFQAISAIRFFDPGIVILPDKKFSTLLELSIQQSVEKEIRFGKNRAV